jgi:two-component system, chemotaxis family, sensor kinase Cph1
MAKQTRFEIFGGAISDCEKTPITRPGSVQRFCALLVLNRKTLIPEHMSSNLRDFIGSGQDSRPLDLNLLLGENAFKKITEMVKSRKGLRAFRLPSSDSLYAQVHLSASHVLVEIERDFHSSCREAIRHFDLASEMRDLDLLGENEFYEAFLSVVSRHIQYERFMLYKFAPDWSGQVVAEVAPNGDRLFQDDVFPPTDIPENVRQQYIHTPLRLIGDVSDSHAELIPLIPNASPFEVDLKDVVARAPAPVHLEYMRAMRVQSSLSVAILANGRLWGLLLCHSRVPRWIDYAQRASLEGALYLASLRVSEFEMRRQKEALDLQLSLFQTFAAQSCSSLSIGKFFEQNHLLFLTLMKSDGVALIEGGNLVYLSSERFAGAIFDYLASDLCKWVDGKFVSENVRTASGHKLHDFLHGALGVLAVRSKDERSALVFLRASAYETDLGVFRAKPPNSTKTGPLYNRPSVETWVESAKNKSERWLAEQVDLATTMATLLFESKLSDAPESETR